MDSRLIIVSNRLPVRYDKQTKKHVQSSGGLVSALAGINLEIKYVWAGVYSEDPALLDSHENLLPITVPDKLYESYYNDVCNGLLWPLFHYESDFSGFGRKSWGDYEEVNRIFARSLLEYVQEGDIIWIHDYHLFLLPQYLRESGVKLQIGFFLHIPFPSSEVFRMLPSRKDILEGLLCCDLLGFQSYDYLSNFSDSVSVISGYESDLMSITHEKGQTSLGVFPVSIESSRFVKEKTTPQVEGMVQDMKRSLGERKMILGVDRLDYIKGIDYKIKAFHRFLKENPEWRGKVEMLQIAVPSRTGIAEYDRIKDEIERLVGMVNGEFGEYNYTPVRYMFTSISFPHLLALYRTADILMVSSKRDGMNLVSMEFIVSQDPEDPGVAVLSEFTGAASILCNSVRINPWDIGQSAEKIKEALLMEQPERVRRHKPMLEYMLRYDATLWARTFLERFSIEKHDPGETTRRLSVDMESFLPEEVDQVLMGGNLVFFLDYDGTLTSIVDDPEEAHIDERVKQTLKALAQNPRVAGIVVVSGRDENFLLKELGDTGVSIAAEHGAVFYDRFSKKSISLMKEVNRSRLNQVRQIMENYSRRIPGSFLEKKKYGIALHYRNSPKLFAEYQGRKLRSELEAILSNCRASVIPGKKVIEARISEANKGSFAHWYLSNLERQKELSDYCVIALGDDKTDEELFEEVNKWGVSIKVGKGESAAKYYLEKREEVDDLLANISAALQESCSKEAPREYRADLLGVRESNRSEESEEEQTHIKEKKGPKVSPFGPLGS